MTTVQQDATSQQIDKEIAEAAEACRLSGARLWVNDFWEMALRHGAYGLHIGQEDLAASLRQGAGGHDASPLKQIQQAGIRLGVSTHTYGELARATALRPSYVSLGPIFPTQSKVVRFGAQGTARIQQWRKLVDCPLVVIGGIVLEAAPSCLEAGADGICVISALTKATDLPEAVAGWKSVLI